MEVLVLAEEDRIAAAAGGTEQGSCIAGVRGHDDAQARTLGENRYAALAVIGPAASQVAADGHPDHHGRRKTVVRPPAQDAELVPELMHRRPDVVEELDLDHG